MREEAAVDPRPRLRNVRESLLELLRGLSDEQWRLQTAASPWLVRDVMAHLLGDDVGRISRGRDGHPSPSPRADETVPVFLARINDEWVQAMARSSPTVLLALLETTSNHVLAYWDSVDLDEVSASVYWAGPGPHAIRLDCARELTEDWVHQQQIRDAVGIPGLLDADTIHLVLDTFLYAIPVALKDRDEGTLTIVVDGVGTWSWVRGDSGWSRTDERGSTTVTVDADTLWRVAVRMIDPEEAQARSRVTGEESLAAAALALVSIIR